MHLHHKRDIPHAHIPHGERGQYLHPRGIGADGEKFGEFFRLHKLRVLETKDGEGGPLAEATVMVEVEGVVEHTAATGQGPVNALDNALRKALLPFYPRLAEMRLRDFKVRVLTASAGGGGEDATGTAAVTRVLIESADSEGAWVTVGVSYDIIEASWQALADSVIYKLYRDEWTSHGPE